MKKYTFGLLLFWAVTGSTLLLALNQADRRSMLLPALSVNRRTLADST